MNPNKHYSVYNFDNGFSKEESTLRFYTNENNIDSFDINDRALDVLIKNDILDSKKDYKEEVFNLINNENSLERLRFDEREYIDDPDVKNFVNFIELTQESGLHPTEASKNYDIDIHENHLSELEKNNEAIIKEITMTELATIANTNKYLASQGLTSKDIRAQWEDQVSGTGLQNAHVFAQESINQILVNNEDFRNGLESFKTKKDKNAFVKTYIDEMNLNAESGNSIRLQHSLHNNVLDGVNDDKTKGSVRQKDGVLYVKNEIKKYNFEHSKTLPLINEKGDYIQLSRLQNDVEKSNIHYQEEKNEIKDELHSKISVKDYPNSSTFKKEFIENAESFNGSYEDFVDEMKESNKKNPEHFDKFYEGNANSLNKAFDDFQKNKNNHSLTLDIVYNELEVRTPTIKKELTKEEKELLKESIEYSKELGRDFNFNGKDESWKIEDFKDEDSYEMFFDDVNNLLKEEPTSENITKRQELSAEVQYTLPNDEIEWNQKQIKEKDLEIENIKKEREAEIYLDIISNLESNSNLLQEYAGMDEKTAISASLAQNEHNYKDTPKQAHFEAIREQLNKSSLEEIKEKYSPQKNVEETKEVESNFSKKKRHDYER